MTTVLHDNIADDEPVEAVISQIGVQLDPAEEYMKRFEAVEMRNDELRQIAASIAKQPDQDQRLFVALSYITQQQKLNEETYDLLVEMSNFFAPK